MPLGIKIYRSFLFLFMEWILLLFWVWRRYFIQRKKYFSFIKNSQTKQTYLMITCYIIIVLSALNWRWEPQPTLSTRSTLLNAPFGAHARLPLRCACFFILTAGCKALNYFKFAKTNHRIKQPNTIAKCLFLFATKYEQKQAFFGFGLLVKNNWFINRFILKLTW